MLSDPLVTKDCSSVLWAGGRKSENAADHFNRL